MKSHGQAHAAHHPQNGMFHYYCHQYLKQQHSLVRCKSHVPHCCLQCHTFSSEKHQIVFAAP